jgi:predicted PurR-regulated permease PerM
MKRILFVDDEEQILKSIVRLFRTTNYEVLIASDGSKALELLKTEEVDLIISDMRMPFMDGTELLQKVKELYPKMIRIILSGYADEKLILKAIQNNVAKIYIFKPWENDTLLNIINQISEFDYKSNVHIQKYLVPMLDQIDIKGYTKNGVNFLVQLATNIGKWSINIFIALILSMFFMLEKNKVKNFMQKFKKSRAAGFYKYLDYFGSNFLNSFGKVIQAQVLIAFTNSILSMIGLGLLGFKQLLGLGVMIFFFCLIPVAGTIASLIPLSMIAFNNGGIKKILFVVILIAALHALESYVLNPKFMAAKTELPVFIIFIILLVSEHFMGVWGLLLGIPLFMFLLDLLNIKASD